MKLFNGAARLTKDGAVTADQDAIAEILRDYDQHLHLAWIPPGKRVNSDKNVWAVIHAPVGVEPYVVLYAEECDYRILQRIWGNDITKHNPLGMIEAAEAAQKAVELKKELMIDEDQRDKILSILHSPKDTYTAPVDGRVVKFKA